MVVYIRRCQYSNQNTCSEGALYEQNSNNITLTVIKQDYKNAKFRVPVS